MTEFESHLEETRVRRLVDGAAECLHLALRPLPESDGYVCEACHRELSALEAQEICSEAAVRVFGDRA
ncbi:MAG: hypothetical protein AB7G21_07710 [Dehalococcoidia bacterium]